jgi:MOSC domain-containing protein YiiM
VIKWYAEPMPLFKHIRMLFKQQPATPTLTAIYVTTAGGEPMQSVQQVEVISNGGLAGDRYHTNNGYWHRVESCTITLISEHDLQQATKRGGQVNNGEHRRNLVIEGIKTKGLKGKRFQMGEATFVWHRPRPPCGYINKLMKQNLTKALGLNSGVCLQAEQGGSIRVGDVLKILD